MIIKMKPGSINYKCDVLIIGAGPAGAALAVFLSGTGLEIILIDKKSYIEEPIRCAEYVPSTFAGLFDFKLKGIDNSIEKLQTFINVAPGCIDKEQNYLSPASELRAPGYIIDRKKMIEDWIARFVKYGGRYMPSTKALKISGTEVTALKGGQQIIIKAQIIAGADGPVSLTAGCIGSAGRHFLAGINLKYKNPDALSICHSTKVFFLPEIKGGYAWVFPGRTFTNYGLGVDLELFYRHYKNPGIQKRLFEHIFGNILKNDEENNPEKNDINSLCGRAKLSSGLIPISGITTNPVQKNIILLGDAAGLCNPVTGAGIFNAVYSSGIAAKYIKKAFGSKDMSVLQEIREEYNDYFRRSLDRACAKRKEISCGWKNQKTPELFERFIKKTWVAFRQYWN
jgi:digeranylgeranylglycerophospholipid reductase